MMNLIIMMITIDVKISGESEENNKSEESELSEDENEGKMKTIKNLRKDKASGVKIKKKKKVEKTSPSSKRIKKNKAHILDCFNPQMHEIFLQLYCMKWVPGHSQKDILK